MIIFYIFKSIIIKIWRFTMNFIAGSFRQINQIDRFSQINHRDNYLKNRFYVPSVGTLNTGTKSYRIYYIRPIAGEIQREENSPTQRTSADDISKAYESYQKEMIPYQESCTFCHKTIENENEKKTPLVTTASCNHKFHSVCYDTISTLSTILCPTCLL